MSYNNDMSNKQEKQYTEEEIKKMSYWQLWELRRKPGLLYFVPSLGVYAFLIYCFIKVLYILGTSDTLEFKVDLWIVPVVLMVGPIYYYFHEWYYKNIYLKKKS